MFNRYGGRKYAFTKNEFLRLCDLVKNKRSETIKEIANGTFSGDLSTEWMKLADLYPARGWVTVELLDTKGVIRSYPLF